MSTTLFIIFIVVAILAFVMMIWGFLLSLKESNERFNEKQTLYTAIHNASTKEEWIQLKAKVIERYAKIYKKQYVEGMTTGTLYGALADKAEELLNKG